MLQKMSRRVAAFERCDENHAVVTDLNNMLPGMFVEQIAAIFLENINVFVMGFISTAAMAGVGQINTVNNVMMNIFQAFAIGGTVIVGRHIGARRAKEGAEAAVSALILGLIVSIAVTALAFVFRKEIVLALFGKAQPEVIKNSLDYFAFTVLTPPLWFVYFQCCGFMRSAGDTKIPMLISILLNVASMVFNLFFALVLHIGVKGAALSYLFSVGLAAALSLAMVMRKTFIIRLRKVSRGDFVSSVSQISFISFPSSAENLMFNGSKIVIQVFLAGMGDVMISANSVFNSVNGIFNVPVMALYFLTVPVISRCAGTTECYGDSNLAKEKIYGALGYISRRCFIWCIPITIAHLFFGIPVSFLFTRDQEVVFAAAKMLAIYGTIVMIQNGSYILPNGFKAVGDARFAMVVSSVSSWVIRVLGTWILGIELGLGVYSVALTQAADIGLRAVVYGKRYKNYTWLKYLFPDGWTKGEGGSNGIRK